MEAMISLNNMSLHKLCVILVIAFNSTCLAAADAPTTRPAAFEELLRKNVSPDHNIVVTREWLGPGGLAGLKTTGTGEGAKLACIRVSLTTAGSRDVLLGSAVQTDYPDSRNGFKVLDAFFAQDEVVLACAMSDSIGLWRICVDLHAHLPDGWAWLRSPVPYQTVLPFNRDTVSISMSVIDEKDWTQHWRVTLVDKRPEKPVIIQLQQDSGCWRFSAAKP